MALEKITQVQMDEQGVCAAPDILDGTPEENKAIFDRMVRSLIAPAYNAAVDAVNMLEQEQRVLKENEEARRDAEQARAAEEEIRKKQESERKDAEEERGNAEKARAAAEERRESEEQGYVAQAKSWAQGNTGTREGEETDNAKYWAGEAKKAAEEAQNIAGGDFATNKALKAVEEKVNAAQTTANSKAEKAVFSTTTMTAAGWIDGLYSFEAAYPNAQYDISIEVAPTATAEQFEAFGAAMICGSASSNVATALGDVPAVDIPIIIKAVAK